MKINLPKFKFNNSNYLSFKIFNHNNKLINPKVLEKGCKISCFLELSEIWLNEKHIGCNWNVLQMKVYPELVFNKCLFYDEEPFEIKNENECFHCNNCINSHCNHNSTFLNSIENKYKKSMISLNELNNKKIL